MSIKVYYYKDGPCGSEQTNIGSKDLISLIQKKGFPALFMIINCTKKRHAILARTQATKIVKY